MAAKAGLALMTIEENRHVCPGNYAGSPTQKELHGGSAENFGHGRTNHISGSSGFHWGTGSALVAAARIKKRYGDLLIDLDAKAAIGIDGIAVKKAEFSDNVINLSIHTLDVINDFRITLNSSKPLQTESAPELCIKGFKVKREKDGTILAKRV